MSTAKKCNTVMNKQIKILWIEILQITLTSNEKKNKKNV